MWNALSSISTPAPGRVTEGNAQQFRNASTPMRVMLAGSVTEASFVHPLKAKSPTEVTPSATFKAKMSFEYSSYHGPRSVKSVMSPVPLMVSVPSFVNSHVREAPHVPSSNTVGCCAHACTAATMRAAPKRSFLISMIV